MCKLATLLRAISGRGVVCAGIYRFATSVFPVKRAINKKLLPGTIASFPHDDEHYSSRVSGD